MKLISVLFTLIVIQSCEFKAQEKITKLPIEDQKLITKALINDKNFELQYIKKIDSSQNQNVISYYNSNFFLSSKKIYSYNENNKLELIRYFDSYFDDDTKNKFLSLRSESKCYYSDGYEKVVSTFLKNGKESGNELVEKNFDVQGRIFQKKSTSHNKNSDLRIIKTFKYNIDDVMVCVEEYSGARTTKSFESCTNYLIENGKITNKILGIEYVYDKKKRLIKEVAFTEDGKPNSENLYIYDDKENTMEHQRYRFSNSKFLVAKDQTFYNADGLPKRIIYFGMSEDDRMLPERLFLIFYNENKKEKIQVELKSKTFVQKQPSPPF